MSSDKRYSDDMANKVAAHIERFVASIADIPDVEQLLGILGLERTSIGVMAEKIGPFVPQWNIEFPDNEILSTSVKQGVLVHRGGKWQPLAVPLQGNRQIEGGAWYRGKSVGEYLQEGDRAVAVHSVGVAVPRYFPVEQWNTISVWLLAPKTT